MPVHLQSLYGLNSLKVGLVFLGGVIPTLICAQTFLTSSIGIFIVILPASPFGGWWVDRYGTEWISFIAVLLTIPWFGLLIPEISLVFFIAMFCVASAYLCFVPCFQNSFVSDQDLFLGAVMPALTTELASLSRHHEGVGCKPYLLLLLSPTA